MKVLVVEDEQQKVRKLERVLKKIDGSIRIIATVPDIFSSAGWLHQHDLPDLILVNKEVIQIKQLTELQNGINATVIFTYQSKQFTFQAFRVNSLKHFFSKNSLNPPAPAAALPAPTAGTVFRNRFLIKQGQRLISIETAGIAYFFSDERFIFLKTYDGQKYLVEFTLEELESMLDPAHFFRINRSLLISFKSVAQIHFYFGNRLKLFLEPALEKEIIVSREKVNDFKAWLGE